MDNLSTRVKRFRELEMKFIDGSITLDEQNELRQLIDEEHGSGRAEEQGTQELGDFIKHDELFRNYPQLRKARMNFADLEGNTMGAYNPDTNRITLDTSLRGAAEDVLVHEIQHAIQKAEGFARGSSPESWEENKGSTQRVAAVERIQGEINALEEMLNSESEEESADLIEADIEQLRETLDRLNYHLYENTAGEIEARDAASRRRMTPEQRRQTMPNTGDENTVFAEDEGEDLQFSISETDDGRAVAVVDDDILSNIDTSDWNKETKEQAKATAKEALKQFKNGVQVNGIDYKVNRTSRREYTRSNDTEMYEDGGATKGDIDRYATEDALRAAVNDEDVAAWIRGQMDDLVGEPGIYNGKERYTSSGNSRSFASLHWKYNAENIVKAMNLAEDRGEGYWGASAEGMMAMATPQYGSVDEMHADETRLRTESEEDRKARFESIDQQIQDIISAVRGETKAHASSSYEENDIIGSVLMQAATGNKSANGIQKAFKREGYNISQTTAQAAADMYAEAAGFPTGYFEAKPQRVVDFDEALAVVTPTDAPAELVAAMRNAGMNVVEYEAGNEEDRLNVVNSIEGTKFSTEDGEDDQELALPGGEEEPVTQGISSAKTSIKQIPALFTDKNVAFGETNIDIGGGRFDLAKDFLAENGTKSMMFDPYNRRAEENAETLAYIQSGKRADTATCANVLNVIAEQAARDNVILEAAKAIRPDGAAYFMVYEGDVFSVK